MFNEVYMDDAQEQTDVTVNRTRMYSTHEYTDDGADDEFRNSHTQVAIDEDCPECDSDAFVHWANETTTETDYDYCPDCGHGRAYALDS